MQERRKYPRIPVTQPATLFRQDGTPITDCLLRDISIGGARLQVEVKIDIPRMFSLQVPRGGRVQRYCAMVWRSDAEMGVKFIAVEHAAATSATADQDEIAHEVALL